MMKLTFLGTGTSTGVPYIGCDCETCRSTDPKDKRLRCSSLLEVNGKNILLDCGPDFRQQALRAGLKKIDAILLTHKHMDHILGLDDLRPYGNVRIYSNEETHDAIHNVFSYCFNNDYKGIPQLETHIITDKKFMIDDIEVTPINIKHYQLPVFGYRIKNFAYITDFSTIEEAELEKLKGLDVLVMDALRWEPHFSHINIDGALEIVEKLQPKETYFVHMTHSLGPHAKAQKKLPNRVYFAYDGLTIEI